MSLANESQIGGSHYKSEYQHWDLVADTGMGYFEGQITKYVSRWRNKNGIQDLQKSLHFCLKLIELVELDKIEEWTSREGCLILADRYCEINRLDLEESRIIKNMVSWSNAQDLADTLDLISGIIAKSRLSA